MSQQCRWIGQFKELSLSKNHATFSKLWSLPSQLSNTESFVIIDEQHFVVAEDKRSVHSPNVFLLRKKSEAG
jgi:hypothetical protein